MSVKTLYIVVNQFIQNFINQLFNTSIIEWLGVVTGFACIYLAAKNHILNWPISIISILCYIILFYQSKLYGEIVLQMYFLFTAIYGWQYWRRHTRTQNSRPITSLSKREYLYVLGVIFVLTLFFYHTLSTYTDTNVPLTDAFCTSVSLVAQYLLTRKILQNWLLWLVVDIIYVPLLMYKNLNLSAILYFMLIILAYIGYSDWKKISKKQAQK